MYVFGVSKRISCMFFIIIYWIDDEIWAQIKVIPAYINRFDHDLTIKCINQNPFQLCTCNIFSLGPIYQCHKSPNNMYSAL